MKLTAKGMFKRLVYNKERILNDRFILYKKPIGIGYCYIRFDLKDKTYDAIYYFGPKGGCCPYILSIKEILAIQKQMEELGDEFIYECRRNV